MASRDEHTVKIINQHGPFGFVMFVAFIGAFVYFSHTTHNFGDVMWALVQAIVWPGILVYHLLLFLGA
ncbi:MAG TPA: hypothetical protein VMT96_01025 [Candidatus Bathyarchaeia archaeon]|nr:hypothetical protein [Candidatus Bathyarchaeia archaeon]